MKRPGWIVIATLLIVSPCREAEAQPELLLELVPHQGVAQFGHSLSATASHVVVGSAVGETHVFDLSTGQLLHKIKHASSVAAFGRRAVLGDMSDDDLGQGAGAAYIFDLVTGQQLAKIYAPDGAPGDRFGNAVALSDKFALVCAYSDDGRGACYVFNIQTGIQLYKITASDGVIGDSFGSSCAIDGHRAVVGAGAEPNGGVGAAYLFDLVTGKMLHKLVPSDGAPQDAFGHSVDIRASNVAIGAIWSDALGEDSGAVYLFDVDSGVELSKKVSPSGFSKHFGASVALDDSTLMVGEGLVAPLRVFDLASDQFLYEFPDTTPASFGSGPTVIVGKRAIVPAPFFGAGGVYVYSLAPDFLPYGTGCAGLLGISPDLSVSGAAEPGGFVRIQILGGVGAGVVLLVAGTEKSPQSISSTGCFLYATGAPQVVVGPLALGGVGAGAGSLNFPVMIPASFATPYVVTLQAFIEDAAAPAGFSSTNGVELNIR